MKYKIVEEKDRSDFIPDLVGGCLQTLMIFENIIFTLMDDNNPDYGGGMWDFIQYENGAKAMVVGSLSDPKVKVPPQRNYWEGEMSPFALSIAINMHLCSNLSFNGGVAGESLGNNYHLLRATLDDDFAEACAIFGFLD